MNKTEETETEKEDETKPAKSNTELFNENKALMQENDILKTEVNFQESLIAQIYDDLDSLQNGLTQAVGRMGVIKQRTKQGLNQSPMKQMMAQRAQEEQNKLIKEQEAMAKKKTK